MKKAHSNLFFLFVLCLPVQLFPMEKPVTKVSERITLEKPQIPQITKLSGKEKNNNSPNQVDTYTGRDCGWICCCWPCAGLLCCCMFATLLCPFCKTRIK
jgi:hypothetical protein